MLVVINDVMHAISGRILKRDCAKLEEVDITKNCGLEPDLPWVFYKGGGKKCILNCL